MPVLLVVHHTPSPSMHSMYEAVVAGGSNPQVEGVDVRHRAALSATASDVLEADGYILGSPANLGYLSGALKHFFDQIYYPCLTETQRRPYGVYLHGNDDTIGALRAVEKITTGLQWRLSSKPVTVVGEPNPTDLEQCWNLGATLAALLLPT